MKHQHDSSNDWSNYDNTFVHPNSHTPQQSNIGLAFLLAIVMGMVFYVGSFYLDREPLPEVSKKQNPSESLYDFPPEPAFEKNFG